MNQFNLVALRRINEGENRAGGGGRRAVAILESEFREVLGKRFQTVHLKREVRKIRLHLHRVAAGKMADLDQFLALRRL